MDFNESPVNYDFFGGQPQISSQHPGMLQSLPTQQSGINDMQLLQQQFMLKQMQAMQRQQQLQKQQEARKLNSMNQVSAFAKQAAANPSQALINGILIHETSNYSWQPERMAANTSWPQRGASPAMQGSFRGHVFSTEQGEETPNLMGMVPQQIEQSLYGVSIHGTRVTPSQYPPVQMDKPSMQQISGSSNSFTRNQYTGFPEQASVQDGHLVSSQGHQGKNMIASSDGQGIDSGFNLENLQLVNPQQNNGPVQEICPRQDLGGLSETSQEETVIQVTSQDVATLDPTEVKILFGSDDNSWGAFGRGANMGSGAYNMLDGTDFFCSLPSVQSGSWSALMQSAVAETSSGDTGLEEWNGLTFRNSEPPAKDQQIPTVDASSKQQCNWDDNGLQSASSLNFQPLPVSHETNTGMNYNNIPGVQQSGVNTSHECMERLQSVSPHNRHIQQFPVDGTKWSDRSLIQKAAVEGSHFYGKAIHSDAGSNAKSIPGSWANQQSMPSYSSNGQPLNSPSGWNFMDSASSSTTVAFKNQGNENTFQDSHFVDKRGPVFEVMGHSTGIWKTNSIAELERAKSAIGNPQVIPLAPPSQQLLIPEHAFSSHGPSLAIGSLNSIQVISNTGEKDHTLSAPTSSVQSLPLSSDTSHGHSRNTTSGTLLHAGNNAQGKFSAAFPPGLPYSKSHLPNQHMPDTGGRAHESFDRFSSQPKQTEESFERGQTNQSARPLVPDTSRHTLHNDFASSADMPQPSDDKPNHARDSAQQFPVLEASPAPQCYASSHDGFSQKMPPTMGTSVPTQPRHFGPQPFQTASNMFKPSLESHNSSGITFSQPQKLDDQIMQTGGSIQAESGECSMNSHCFVGKDQPAKGDQLQQVLPENDRTQKTMSASHEKESVVNHLTEMPASNLTSTQKQIEAFGRSLKPNNVLHQNYSLLHQMQGMKNAEVEHVNRSLKRLRSPDGSVDAHLVATQGGQQFYGHNNMVRDTPANNTSTPPGHSKMLSFSPKTADNQDITALSKDMLAFSQTDFHHFSNSSTAVSATDEHSQTSNQMALSRFDHHGTFKNGHILPMHDARQDVAMKTSELPSTAGRPSDRLLAHSSLEQGNDVAASQFGIVQNSAIISSIACENFSTPQSLQRDSTDVNLVAMRPKKRRSAISKHVPWHKEVTMGPQRLQNLSAAEVVWALAANRLTKKVEDEVEMVDDGLPVHRSKRRLILTTQLMQILLHPPLASILSADAILHHESAAYFVARSTQGDACSTLSCTGSDAPVPSNSGDLLPEKTKSSEKIRDRYFSKVMEDLISRTRKLENELRLDKRASVSDLRVECQDLERFSVINRFAKFHGRGQTDGAESSLSSDASANAHKSCLQRYVTALPMPRNLPDRVQCLSL